MVLHPPSLSSPRSKSVTGLLPLSLYNKCDEPREMRDPLDASEAATASSGERWVPFGLAIMSFTHDSHENVLGVAAAFTAAEKAKVTVASETRELNMV